MRRNFLAPIIRPAIIACAALLMAPLSASAVPSPRSNTAVGTPFATPTATCDRDGDGAQRADLAQCGGTDCNDLNNKVNPLASEGNKSTCQDGLDNNCNGKTDCSDPGCDGQRVLTPGSITLEMNGMCCSPSDAGSEGGVVNILKDNNNCGGCRVRCPQDKLCVEGTCIASCDIARTQCFTDSTTIVAVQPPIQRDRFGKFPGPIQRMLDAYLGDPSCPRPTREPTFDIKTFSKPLTDLRGKPTGESLRGVCVSINF